MEKVKVTKEQARAIKATQSYNQEKDVLRYIVQDLKTPNDIFHSLNDMSLNDLMSAFVNGYEVKAENEFKVGDWVLYFDYVNLSGSLKVVKIIDIQHEHGRVQFETLSGWRNIRDINKYATKKEINVEQERQFWLKIGRKVGVFEVGDIIIDDEGIVFQVKEEAQLHDNHLSLKEAKEWYEDGDFIGFYPADSFMKFPEEEA